MKIKHLAIVFLSLLFGVLASCEYETIVPEEVIIPEVVSFSADIAPIFVNAGCATCHGGGTPPDLRADKSHASLTGGGFTDNANPAASRLIVKIDAGHPSPGKITAEERAKILKWITDGAKND